MTCWLWKNLRSFQNHRPRDIWTAARQNRLFSLSLDFFITQKAIQKTSESWENGKCKNFRPFCDKKFYYREKVSAVFGEFTPWKLLKQWESERVKKCCRWTLNFTWKFFKIFLLSFSRQLPCHLRSTLFMRISLTFWSFLSLSLSAPYRSHARYIFQVQKLKKAEFFFSMAQ